MGDWYKLDEDGKTPIPMSIYDPGFSDVKNQPGWRVGLHSVKSSDGRVYRVSTVFLRLDHRYGEGDPLLWETMIFPEDSYRDLFGYRYSTWEDAKRGHDVAVEILMTGILPEGMSSEDRLLAQITAGEQAMEPQVVCRRCGRKLRSPKAVEAGIGPVCARKERSEIALAEVTEELGELEKEVLQLAKEMNA